jgi:hypothetical protein
MKTQHYGLLLVPMLLIGCAGSNSRQSQAAPTVSTRPHFYIFLPGQDDHTICEASTNFTAQELRQIFPNATFVTSSIPLNPVPYVIHLGASEQGEAYRSSFYRPEYLIETAKP